MHPTILLVDDDDILMMLIERALKISRLKASLRYVWDGYQAISYLSHQGIFKDEGAFPAPAVVLLDLKMPRVDGFEVLQWRSGRPELTKTPFVVLTSSVWEPDKKRAAELGARDYLTKPTGVADLAEMAEYLKRFWRQSCDRFTDGSFPEEERARSQ